MTRYIMKTWFETGLHLIMDGVHLVFDPTDWFKSNAVPPKDAGQVDIILLSHAHGDHSNLLKNYEQKKGKKGKPINTPVVLHPASNEIIYRRINRPVEMKRGEKVKYKNLVISAYESGHCVGSLQFKIESSEGTFLFTGDINTMGSMSNDKGEIVPADYIAIEATAGESSRVAGPREETYAAIHDFIVNNLSNGNKNVVLYGHSLGKMQELTKLIGFFSDVKARILLDRRSFRINKIYESFRGKFDAQYQELTKETLSEGRKNIILVGMTSLKVQKKTFKDIYGLKEDPPSIIISAFPVEGMSFKNINVSSHDDYNALINYINVASEKLGKKPTVIVFHGEHESFAKTLSNLGYRTHDPHEAVFDSSMA